MRKCAFVVLGKLRRSASKVVHRPPEVREVSIVASTDVLLPTIYLRLIGSAAVCRTLGHCCRLWAAAKNHRTHISSHQTCLHGLTTICHIDLMKRKRIEHDKQARRSTSQPWQREPPQHHILAFQSHPTSANLVATSRHPPRRNEVPAQMLAYV
jgi:hypothetical protein